MVQRRRYRQRGCTEFKGPGRTPSVEGRPSFSRKKDTEPGPRSGMLRSVASEASRISPIFFIPAAFSAFRIRVESRTRSIKVRSGSSGVGWFRLLPLSSIARGVGDSGCRGTISAIAHDHSSDGHTVELWDGDRKIVLLSLRVRRKPGVYR